ncbi:hypothetical protein ABIF64_001892 [Bradyrhizobium japonicum]
MSLQGAGGRIGGKGRDVKATGRFWPVVPGRARARTRDLRPHIGCHRPARPGDPVFHRRRGWSRGAAAYWMPRSSRGMTAERGGARCASLTHPSITKTAMIEVPYHHIKGVFAPVVSSGVPQAFRLDTLFAAVFGLSNNRSRPDWIVSCSHHPDSGPRTQPRAQSVRALLAGWPSQPFAGSWWRGGRSPWRRRASSRRSMRRRWRAFPSARAPGTSTSATTCSRPRQAAAPRGS